MMIVVVTTVCIDARLRSGIFYQSLKTLFNTNKIDRAGIPFGVSAFLLCAASGFHAPLSLKPYTYKYLRNSFLPKFGVSINFLLIFVMAYGFCR